jgi:hypothetical protein
MNGFSPPKSASLGAELRVADVAYLSAARFQQADPEDNIRGAPDIVVEVLFRRRDLREGEALPGERCHPVLAPDGRTVTYRAGQQVPLDLFTTHLAVDAIFA